jgi:hypothetical protein
MRSYAGVAAIGREHGMDSAKIENIASRGRIASRIFHRHFASGTDCIEHHPQGQADPRRGARERR